MRTGWDLAFSNSYNVPRAGAATVPRPTIILPEHCEEILTRECGPAEVADAARRQRREGGPLGVLARAQRRVPSKKGSAEECTHC